MSLGLELARSYIPGRVTSFSDLATNTLGMVLGGFAAIVVGAGFQGAVHRRRSRPAGPDPAGGVVARISAVLRTCR